MLNIVELQRKIATYQKQLKDCAKQLEDNKKVSINTNIKFSKEIQKKDDIIIEKNNVIINLQNEIFRLQEELGENDFMKRYLDDE